MGNEWLDHLRIVLLSGIKKGMAEWLSVHIRKTGELPAIFRTPPVEELPLLRPLDDAGLKVIGDSKDDMRRNILGSARQLLPQICGQPPQRSDCLIESFARNFEASWTSEFLHNATS